MIYLTMGLMLIFAVMAVFLHDTLLSVLALAVVSTLLSIAFFQMNAPVAAVLELSVGAGLITVLAVLTISFIQQRSEMIHKHKRLWVIFSSGVVAAVTILFVMQTPIVLSQIPAAARWGDVGEVFWKARAFDLMPQALVILAAAFGVLALVRTNRNRD